MAEGALWLLRHRGEPAQRLNRRPAETGRGEIQALQSNRRGDRVGVRCRGWRPGSRTLIQVMIRIGRMEDGSMLWAGEGRWRQHVRPDDGGRLCVRFQATPRSGSQSKVNQDVGTKRRALPSIAKCAVELGHGNRQQADSERCGCGEEAASFFLHFISSRIRQQMGSFRDSPVEPASPQSHLDFHLLGLSEGPTETARRRDLGKRLGAPIHAALGQKPPCVPITGKWQPTTHDLDSKSPP
jgi:hypothetical protein